MTGKGANSWFLPEWKHLLQPECTLEEAYGGIACDNTVEVRRIAIWGMPSNFDNMEMKIVPYDQSIIDEKTADGTL